MDGALILSITWLKLIFQFFIVDSSVASNEVVQDIEAQLAGPSNSTTESFDTVSSLSTEIFGSDPKNVAASSSVLSSIQGKFVFFCLYFFNSIYLLLFNFSLCILSCDYFHFFLLKFLCGSYQHSLKHDKAC